MQSDSRRDFQGWMEHFFSEVSFRKSSLNAKTYTLACDTLAGIKSLAWLNLMLFTPSVIWLQRLYVILYGQIMSHRNDDFRFYVS